MESSSRCSSMAAGLPRESFLQRTLERLPSTQSLKLTAEEAAPVAVVAVQRYLSEPTEGQQLDSYSYDVTITDGVWRAKCFLHPSLNHLVHRNTLRTGTDVSVRQCSFVYNERRLGHGYICIEKVEGSAETSAVLQSDVPLQVSRKHYLSLWNNDDPEGDMWISGRSEILIICNIFISVSKVTLLSSLESSFRVSWKPLPLLVKIIHKSRLRYYGKFGLKIDYPYQTYFEVADQSGTMSLVLWNELCPEYYLRMNVGAVLYLQNYTLKQSYSNRSRPQMDHHRMKNFTSIEICLNPRNPAADITVVSPKSVLPQWGLPEVSYQFTTRSELEKISNGSACDVIGLVTFVGRVERVRSKGSKEKYWTYRWVHSVDGTSDRPFILELFSSSQPEIFSQICPMTYLVCTQMRVCQAEGSLPYLTSSCETEIFITGYHKGQPYVSDPRVKSFIQWTKTLKDNVVLQKTAVGGHYCYPPPPRRFSQSAGDLSDLFIDFKESLQYREHKKLAIQGEITAIRYTNYPKKVSNEPKNYSSDTHKDPADYSAAPSWESSSWSKQREEISEHLHHGGLHQDSISRRFTFDEKSALSLSFQCVRSQHGPLILVRIFFYVFLSGINKQIAVDAAFLPVVRSDDPRAVGLSRDPHDNSMRNKSLLSSSPASPVERLALISLTFGCLLAEEILATARGLENTHVVCVLELCQLGGDKVEILIDKVYKVMDVTLD
uniref:Uncharacterized protein n=1 Tax=Xiphophorus couchianus TaxID=32473 RepID=A0A3B5LB65_9TELE